MTADGAYGSLIRSTDTVRGVITIMAPSDVIHVPRDDWRAATADIAGASLHRDEWDFTWGDGGQVWTLPLVAGPKLEPGPQPEATDAAASAMLVCDECADDGSEVYPADPEFGFQCSECGRMDPPTGFKQIF